MTTPRAGAGDERATTTTHTRTRTHTCGVDERRRVSTYRRNPPPLLLLLAVVVLLFASHAQACGVLNEESEVSGSGSGPFTSATYDPTGASKIVVILGGEHSFSNNVGGAVTSVSWGGTAMTEVVQEKAGVATLAIYYIDNPGTTSQSVSWSVNNHNGTPVIILFLENTEPGMGASAKSQLASISLTTTAASSFVIAGVLDAGSNGGNGAPNLVPDAPLTESANDDVAVRPSSSRYTSLSVGFATIASAGTNTFSFSNAGATDTLGSAVAEVLCIVPPELVCKLHFAQVSHRVRALFSVLHTLTFVRSTRRQASSHARLHTNVQRHKSPNNVTLCTAERQEVQGHGIH
jgi:hypothetical protein